MEVVEQEALLSRLAQAGALPADVDRIRAVFDSYAWVAGLVEQKSMSVTRLRQILFGSRTEKTADVLGPDAAPADPNSSASAANSLADPAAAPADPSSPAASAEKPKRKGHGRNGAADYPGAKRVSVPLESLKAGDLCLACGDGIVYDLATPGVLIRLTGQAPVQAIIYELQKLRCNLCGKIFTAAPPASAGSDKHDATVGSVIALLKYGGGFPFHRFERFQENVGLPLPASTQWEIVEEVASMAQPAYDELVRRAAQGEVLHNDDTAVKILERMRASAIQPTTAEDAADERQQAKDRTGLFTTGIVATNADQRIALFFSGPRHAGENLAEVLKHRTQVLPPPIQMCDALSRNVPRDFQTILANCLAHARRKFVEVTPSFKDECKYVLEAIGTVYHHDAEARRSQLTPDERLKCHQTHSEPVLNGLKDWMQKQVDERLVEPNSGLGTAIEYLRKHWTKLTLFLRVPGAPLDNNIVERALKKAILHRKNALFFRTQHGADVADRMMKIGRAHV